MLGLRLKHLQAVGEGDLVHDKDGAPVEFRIPCRSKGKPILPERVCCTAPLLLKNGSKTIRYRDRRIEDVPTWLEVQRQRFKCKTCGATIYECLPDLDDKHRITKRLREAVALSAVKRTHQDAATFHAVEETLVSRIFNEYATEKLSGFEVNFPEVLGVDENYILGANRFIHADIETGKILDILPSRDLKTLRNYFQKHTHSSTKTKVFVQDMWSGYRTIHNEFFPDSLLVVDKFHVVRQANVAFENARKAYQAQLGKSGRVSMKRRHRMFLSRWDNMTNERQDKIAEILNDHPDLMEAYRAKEEFFYIYDMDSKAQAISFYERWLDRLPAYLTRHFQPLITSMKNWHEPIFNYHDARYTNGMVENLNGRINKINSAAHGMKFETLRVKALLRYGDIIPLGHLAHFCFPFPISKERMRQIVSTPIIRGFNPSTLERALRQGRL